MSGNIPLYQCDDGDFEGEEAGALHHCSITGHRLVRKDNRGHIHIISKEKDD